MKWQKLKLILIFCSVSAVRNDEDSPVSQQCLACICEAISSCDPTEICYDNVCGPFRITWAYWTDAGKPTINGEANDSPTAFKNCTQNINCSVLTVQGHMRTFKQDCNGDGVINCDDFIAIHKLGGYGCKGKTEEMLTGVFARRYQECKDIVGATFNDL